jgi:hypothetical protein
MYIYIYIHTLTIKISKLYLFPIITLKNICEYNFLCNKKEMVILNNITNNNIFIK